MSGNLSILTHSIEAAGPLQAHRFVTKAGAYADLGSRPIGVTRYGASASGELVAVDVMGTTFVEAAGPFTKDAPLMVDAAGRVVAHNGDTGKHGLCRAMQDGVAGPMVEVLLTQTP